MSNRWTISSLAVVVAVLTTACGGSSGDTTTTAAPVATVAVALIPPSISVGGASTATATLRDSGGTLLTGRTVAWSSSAAGVATVSATGAVTGVASGTASIIATSEGKTGSATVTVTAAVATVTPSVSSPLAATQTAQAQAAVRDASGHTIPGKTVTWASSAPGIASVVAGTGVVTAVSAGTATLTATCDGVSGTTSVTVLPQGTVPTQIVAVSALSQTGPPATSVVQAPAVAVKDASNNPVQGIVVTFTVTAGGGSVPGDGAVTTGVDGVARLGSWTFGPAGAQTVRAAAASVAGQSVDFAGLARAPGDHYDITLRFISPMSDVQARAFVNAKNRIEEFVVGEIDDQYVNFTGTELAAIGCGNVRVTQTVDDVLILAEVAPIDGVNGILGQAGPCAVRPTGDPALPVLGHMMFDTADLDAMAASGQLEDVILHEMLHVIGFGTVWASSRAVPLLFGSGTANPYFAGAQARSNFASRNGGGIYAGTPVPVEGTGGPGTADAHWRESVFVNELMTGYINRGVNPLSATTIGSLQDLGYGVNVDAANPYTVPSSAIRAGALGVEFDAIFMGNDTRTEPPIVIGPDGRPIP